MTCMSTSGFSEGAVPGPGGPAFPPAHDATIADPARGPAEIVSGDENPLSVEFEYGIIFV